MIIKILLSGDGGQGIQLMSDLICRGAIEQGFFVSHIPNYGLEQRGGVSLAFIQISDSEIAYPKFSKPDVLVVLSEQARERTKQFSIFPDKVRDPVFHRDNFQFSIKDYEHILKKNNVPAQSYNIFFLGLVAKMLEEKNVLKREVVFGMLEKKLGGKPNWEENIKTWELAEDIGYQM